MQKELDNGGSHMREREGEGGGGAWNLVHFFAWVRLHKDERLPHHNSLDSCKEQVIL